ncbi:MAG: tetratricopeptide repeat protein, partial [Chloroflexota bacterium]
STGNLEKAKDHYLQAIAAAKDGKYHYGQANASSSLGNLLSRQGHFDQAKTYLTQAAQYFEKIGSLYNLASVVLNMSITCSLASQYQEALESGKKSLTLFEQFNEPFGKAASAGILAETYLGLNELDEAEQFARLVIQEEEIHTLPDGLRTLGEVRLRQKKFAEAEQLINQSIALTQAHDDLFLEGYGWRALGEVYVAQRSLEAARDALGKAIAIFEKIETPEEIRKTTAILAQFS